MSGGTAPFFRVVYSESVRGTLHGLGVREKEVGVGAAFVSVLQAIDGRLRADPLAVGESSHFLHNLGLHVRLGGTQFFYLRFAVDEGRRLVYVIDCVASARLD